MSNIPFKVTRVAYSDSADSLIEFYRYSNSFIGWLINLTDEEFNFAYKTVYSKDYYMESIGTSLIMVRLFKRYPKIGEVINTNDWDYYYSKVKHDVTSVREYRLGNLVIDYDSNEIKFKRNDNDINEYIERREFYNTKNFTSKGKLK